MKRIFNKRTLLLIPVLLIIGASIAAAVYFYQKYQAVKKNPQIVSQEQVKVVTSAISQFMNLPSDEDPTLATVTDISKLKGQDFFKNAKNGDDVLIYTKAQKAILYRPSTNRVIEFAPLTIGQQPQQGTVAGDATTQSVKVAIYNGTTVPGLTNDVESKLSQITGLSIVTKTNAATSDYTKTAVIDLSGKNQTMTNKIAEALGGTVQNTIPTGETKPQADILVIAAQ